MNGEEAFAAYVKVGEAYLETLDRDDLALGILDIDEQLGDLEILTTAEFDEACKLRNSIVGSAREVLKSLNYITPYGARIFRS